MPPKPPDMRCRALVGGSGKRDMFVFQCQATIIFVTSDGRHVKEDPGDDPDGYWSIYDATHHDQLVADRAADVRDANGDRAYGPQRILKGQQSDSWVDPVEGGTRWPVDG